MNSINKFQDVAITEDHEKWEHCIKRYDNIYTRDSDVRSPFSRDYDRIMHCTAFRRLKHKTQVFFATENDHICTRIEHVTHVASISDNIAFSLGLNRELVKAIAIGHDLGHPPFGHEGEYAINKILQKELDQPFWHEKNSLNFADNLETLPNPSGEFINLGLTYAVRDGIISHCGEIDERCLMPRERVVDLHEIQNPSEYPPFTWEGCVVKVADKIAFWGRDIEDALTLGFLNKEQIDELRQMLNTTIQNINLTGLVNTELIHDFVNDLCISSSPEKGLCFSEDYMKLMESIREFNFKNIYFHPRLDYFKKYADLIISSLYECLLGFYHEDKDVLLKNLQNQLKVYPLLIQVFINWTICYSDISPELKEKHNCKNRVVYTINDINQYKRCIVDFISGMTDNFAKKVHKELISF